MNLLSESATKLEFAAGTAVVLFAHGSRDPLWKLPMEAVAKAIVERQPKAQVRCSYLELCAPTLMQAVSELIAAGAISVRVFPLFLGVGKHAREDLPVLMEELRHRFPDVRMDLMPTAGENPALISLMAELALS